MTLLTSVAGTFRAHVILARLEAEGIDAQLRGALDGAYGFTMGDLARVDVFVPDEQLDDAKYVLLADEVDATLSPPTEWWDAGAAETTPRARWPWWVAVGMVVIAVSGAVLRSIAG